MLVNKVVPGFYNGMSQQPPGVRLDTQCELEVNGYSSLVDGMTKRPPTQHVAILGSNSTENSFMHTINRDEVEKYKVIITGNLNEPIEIFTLDGAKCNVRYGFLGATLSFIPFDGVKQYVTALGGNAPSEVFKATTVADYTILCNNTFVGAKSGTISGTRTPEGIVYVKKGVANCDYEVTIDGAVVASYTSGDTTDYNSYKSNIIANALYEQLRNGHVRRYFANGSNRIFAAADANNIEVYIGATKQPTNSYTISGLNVTFNTAPPIFSTVSIRSTGLVDFDCVLNGSAIKVSRKDGNTFSMACHDGWGEQALLAVKGQVQKFTDLPAGGFQDFTVEIAGDPNNDFDNFWVRYEAQGTSGAWVETVKPGIDNTFNADTLPHRLVRTGINEFTLATCDWKPRRVGDEDTNADPSFIGRTVNDIFFYRNRLGMLSGENVILSKAGEFFDFWAGSASAVLDDDPIDVSVSTNEVSTLHHAIPFNTNLLVFSDQIQFMVHSGDQPFTPKTVVVDTTTHFPTSPTTKPVGAGANVYFMSPRGDYSTIKEYFVQASSLNNDAADVTAHVPRLVPKNVSKLASCPAMDTVFCLSKDTPDTLYVYHYFWSGDQKAQSAWQVWDFNGQVLNMEVLDTYLYLLINRQGVVCLERIRLEPKNTGSLFYRVHLDRLVTVTGVYNPSTFQTTWTLPYSAAGYLSVIRGDDGNAIQYATSSGVSVSAPGDFSSVPCHIGTNYEHRYRFSEWHIKSPNSNVTVLQGRLQIRTLTVYFTDTGYFRVEGQAKGRNKIVKAFTGGIIGNAVIGVPNLCTGSQRFSILANALGTAIDIVNDTHLPSAFHSASMEGFYTTRSKPL